MNTIHINKIKPNDHNPRYITQEDYNDLLESLKGYAGMSITNRIKLDEDNMILGGNMRIRAMKQLGWTDIYYDRFTREEAEFTNTERAKHGMEPLTYEEQCRAFIIKDNIHQGSWDWDILANEYTQEELWDLGLEVPDAISMEEENLNEDDYEMPEDMTPSDIKDGDVFQIGPHRLICGDATKPKTYSKLLDKGQNFDAIITDPPYNVNYEGGTGLKIENDNMLDSQFHEFLLAFFKASLERTQAGGSIYVWHADSEGLNFRSAMTKAGWLTKQCLIWVKSALVMGRQDYQWKHEPCLYGWRPGGPHYFIKDRTKTTTLEDEELDLSKMTKKEMTKLLEKILSDPYTTTIKHAKPRRNDVHPTMKPVLLIGDLIKNSTKPGQIIGDPFLGSASTMVAAHQLKRICYGMELDPKYCKVILDRMTKLEPGIAITKNGKEYELQH